jgi:dipicolinate synthase subunit A
MVKSCLLIGGDHRHKMMADWFAQKGMDVFGYGMNEIRESKIKKTVTIIPTDLVILPVPVSRDGITIHTKSNLTFDDFVTNLSPTTIVCGGYFPSALCEKLDEKGIRYFDFGKEETFALQNAVPTAEGAIEIVLQNTPFTLKDAKVCVIGFGRIGKALTSRLLGLECNLYVTARKDKDLLEIKRTGAVPVHTKDLYTMDSFDVIFNTVPAAVVTKSVLDKQTQNTLIIDLASKPGGVDFEYAKEKNIPTIHALSLPAKCAPITAAKIIFRMIEQFLTETDDEQ